MRVITGSARGVRLKTPDGMKTRPTAERVKEALFSAIQFEIQGARFLDLLAGTGQMGMFKVKTANLLPALFVPILYYLL